MSIRPTDVYDRKRTRLIDSARRWAERTSERAALLTRVHRREDADSEARIASFARREAARPAAPPRLRSAVAEATRTASTRLVTDEAVFVRLLESKIGPTLDWSLAPPTTDANRAGRPVARLCTAPSAERQVGFATGFLVSNRLLLTNHHVFSTKDEARGTFANFLHEQRDAVVAAGLFFDVDPDSFFLSSKELDLALVAVTPQSTDGTIDLAELGHLPLLAETGKVLIGHPITIIQHPDGGPKTFADRQNRLIDVLENHLHYSTDTLPGSSGAPCFNRAWELVALHHCGIPRMQGNEILTVANQPWDGEDVAEVAWEANEGVRATVVRAHLQSRRGELDPLGQALMDDAVRGILMTRVEDNPETEPAKKKPGPPLVVQDGSTPESTEESSTMSNTVVHVHGQHANVYVRCSFGTVSGSVPATAPTAGPPPPDALEKKLRFDPDYDNRGGYDPDFLGVSVPMPGVTAERKKQLLKGLDAKPLVLRYHHFSLVMNKDRYLQMWSAANVDYSEAARRHSQNREAFGTDTWISDPRVPDDYQLLDVDFYAPAKNIDRGHVLRREDNAWGATFTETEHANSDTFHWTNCTPQHERFNQSRLYGRWGGLEDQVKAESQAAAPRLSIFAGPVLADDDPEALGIQYPVRFWKVIAAIVDGALAAYGFVLDQSNVVEQYGLGLERKLDFDKLAVHQSSLASIETLTGVRFPKVLGEADVLLAEPDPIDVLFPESVRLRRKPAADPVSPL